MNQASTNDQERIPVGVDVGWFQTKVCGPNRQDCFVSMVGPTPADYGSTAITTLAKDLPYRMTEPFDFLIGDAAYVQGIGTPDLTAEWVQSERYLALMLTALAGDMDWQNAAYEVVTGLPPAYMYLKDWLEQEINGTYRVKFDGGATQYVDINLHAVAQGVGAMLTTVIDKNGDIAPERLNGLLNVQEAELSAIVDSGAGTSCLVLARGVRPVDESTTSIKYGAWAIEAHARSALARELGPASVEQLSRHELLTKLRKNSFRFKGTVYDTDRHFRKAIAHVADRVIQEMRAKWGDATHVDRLIIAGGGGALMVHEIYKAYPHAQLVNTVDPVLANAEGYRRLAKLTLGLG